RMTAAGPAAKRPPHMTFAFFCSESAMRPVIALLPAAALMLALRGCDKQSGDARQGAGNAAGADEVTSSEGASDEMPAGPANATGSDATFSHVIDRSHKGEAMPAHSFLDPAGKPTSLASQAAGKPFIVNLWATWCAPCVAELPALDRFAGMAAGRG